MFTLNSFLLIAVIVFVSGGLAAIGLLFMEIRDALQRLAGIRVEEVRDLSDEVFLKRRARQVHRMMNERKAVVRFAEDAEVRG